MSVLPLSVSVLQTGSRLKTDIDALFLEFKVAAQFAKTWDRAEENVALIRRKEMQGSLPTQDDLAGLTTTISRGGSPAYWMSQVYDTPPRWFVRDECGVGTADNVFDTIATLKETNLRRSRKYAEMLRRLEQAREVLSRTVRG